MPTGTEPRLTGGTPVTDRDRRGAPGESPACPILRTVLDAHDRDRAEVNLVALARLAAPLHA
ncbi:hypothetical protein [Saccharothrix variisporea]|uniref:Uncharacterized protein n=1 Tax=Saccharothrix variisporea TaxID=543527 RepID=A0A495XAA4_9PSEU|nr:hypothetical protein [Saccharothrix variisporea]RKT70932.1 hypothetical protein DFJ66_4209 [Saccharothrix variisporea]